MAEEEISIAPLSMEELVSEDYELIFVQHPSDMGTHEFHKKVRSALRGKASSQFDLEKVEYPAPIYPVAVNGGTLAISRPVDSYYVVVPKDIEE